MMNTQELRAELQEGRFKPSFRLYGVKPAEWADMPVHERFPDGDVIDGGEVVRRKTYREYLIILANDSENVLARLCKKEADSNIHCELEPAEMAATVALVGLENIYCHDEALQIRDEMVEEPGV